MELTRFIRHAAVPHWRTRIKFPAATLDAIEKAVAHAERTHGGEIRFVIESSLTPHHIFRRVSSRARAHEVFSTLGVWDTEHNNGVLIYVQLADRHVEIIADRGFLGHVACAEWEGVCRLMEAHFRAGRYRAGSIAGVDAVGTLLSRHYPAPAAPIAAMHNQLPDRPTLL